MAAVLFVWTPLRAQTHLAAVHATPHAPLALQQVGWRRFLSLSAPPNSGAVTRRSATGDGGATEALAGSVHSGPPTAAPLRQSIPLVSCLAAAASAAGAAAITVFGRGRVAAGALAAPTTAPPPSPTPALDRRHALTALLTAAPFAATAPPAFARPQPHGVLAQWLGIEESKEDFETRVKRVKLEMELEEMAESRALAYSAGGFKYRDVTLGTGRPLQGAPTVLISYTLYKLAKRSYGGLMGDPVYMFSRGYGLEFQDDIGDALRVGLRDLPVAVQDAMQGMKEKGRRRILVPPEYGWVSDDVQPRPTTYGGQRQLVNHGQEPLVFEVDLVKVVG
eukprot:EG_transcript_13573